MRLAPTIAAVATLLWASAAVGQSLKPDEVFSSIAVRPVSDPDPVLGADARVHLAYELLVVNPSNLFVTLDKVEAVGGGRSLSALEGARLAAMTRLYAGSGRTLPPGGSGVVFMDVSLAKDEPPPSGVLARITATRQAAGADGRPAPLPSDFPFPPTFTFTGASAGVSDKPAVVLAPPLRGRGWVAMNGCCDSITSHRGAVMTVNGQLRIPERFAIDWVKLDDTGRIFTGAAAKLTNYAYYGAPVLAAADGVVVNLYNGADEQIPGPEAKGINADNIGGNMLVVDIGGGAYAFYAHLQRDSLKVKLGDRVRTGQVLGLLGNTGNSTAPHLHFHVMDGPSPLNANGLPFVFTRFTSRGVLSPGTHDAIETGKAVTIDPRLAGAHTGELPLNNQVVDFD